MIDRHRDRRRGQRTDPRRDRRASGHLGADVRRARRVQPAIDLTAAVPCARAAHPLPRFVGGGPSCAARGQGLGGELVAVSMGTAFSFAWSCWQVAGSDEDQRVFLDEGVMRAEVAALHPRAFGVGSTFVLEEP